VNPAHIFAGTHQDNMDDMDAKGRRRTVSVPAEDHYAAKLTNDQVREIRALYEAGNVTQTALSHRFGVTQSTIHLIVRNKKWRSVA
jgi:DNA-binding MarR family transcriptional regulator